ncbi:MAG TPA: hypothetical protein VG077_20295 [Verrucomicrobiae bacterium]|nr:hypothetical protein [Verrucomicrobiae bacterium]
MKIKSPTGWLAAVLAVAGGLTLAGQVQAQDTYYWYYFYPPWPPNSSLYANWNNYPGNPSAVNFTTVFAYTNGVLDEPASGLEVTSAIGGYGSGYADLNHGTGVTFANGNLALATNDTTCTLTFTVNPTPGMASSGTSFYTNYNWIGIQFYLNLDSGAYTGLPVLYGGWNNPGNSNGIVWVGSNVTMTVNLSSLPKFTAYTQGGTNHFYGCNLGVSPAVIFNDPSGSSGLPYDITFNTITFAPAATLPPNLAVSHVGTNVIVSWPATGSYTLQQSANMARFSWSPWGFPPDSNNGIYSITIPAPANTLFFRLSSP